MPRKDYMFQKEDIVICVLPDVCCYLFKKQGHRLLRFSSSCLSICRLR